MAIEISESDHTSGIPPLVVPPPTAVQMYGKRVLIVCPWQKVITPATAFCIAQLADKRRTSLQLNWGDAFVAHARNSCADYFLKSQFDWMLTVDDDMILPCGNAEWFRAYTGWKNFPDPFAGSNIIDRLMSHNKTLVGALYFAKYPGGPPVFNEGARSVDKEYANNAPYNELKPTRWVGTGAMLIHRSVFLDIEKKFPYLARKQDGKGGQWFTSSEHNVMQNLHYLQTALSKGPMDGNKALKAYEIVEGLMAEARAKSSLGMGEDVSFCLRASEAGHQPYVDLGAVCGHVGYACFGPERYRK